MLHLYDELFTYMIVGRLIKYYYGLHGQACYFSQVFGHLICSKHLIGSDSPANSPSSGVTLPDSPVGPNRCLCN